MHIEIQVALNFVISYLYNKLPRRRVNIFGEELEKALKDKFQGHWYPEKPFKGSAFRCLKTGDPIDSVLERAARESGVPITDILENLPSELSVWVDPGEVSYRIGEKGAVKILYSENNDNHEDSSSADREVTKTFNPEAQCFRPIDAVSSSMNGLSLSPKTSPHSGSSPASSTSPTYKGSPNPASNFLARSQAPLTFTTATFAQTKFGSTKLKTSSKRANSSYRMSPTEFSNYIKQRAMQQQFHHSHGPAAPNNHFGPIGPSSPSRSLSPNPLGLGIGQNDPFYFPNIGMGLYPQFNGHRNIFDSHFHADTNGIFNGSNNTTNPCNGTTQNGHAKFSSYIEPHGFYGLNNQLPQQQPLQQNGNSNNLNGGGANLNNNTNATMPNNNANNNVSAAISAAVGTLTAAAAAGASAANSGLIPGSSVNGQQAQQQQQQQQQAVSPMSSPGSAGNQDSNNSKLIDGLNSFYSNATGPYQHLLVAN